MVSNITRRDALRLAAAGGAALTAGLATPSILRAQAYPSRPINIIVPFATGGLNDRIARGFAPYLEKEFGQPMVIVNQEGAGAQLGHTYAIQQPTDGYTILCTSASPYIPLSILLQNAPYKVEDFWMINLPSRDYTLAATSADSKIENFAQAIESLKADPQSLSIGVQPASADYANMVLAFKAAGIDHTKVRVVTYDGGGPARNAVVGGQIDIGLVGAEGFLPLKDKIKALAIFAAEPASYYPEAPLLATSGLQTDFVEGSQRGWVVTTKLKEEQPDIYATIAGAIERACKNPEAVEMAKAQQLPNTWYGADDSNAAFRANAEKMAQYVDLLK